MTHLIITGASSGLGAALAIGYAASGVRLSLHGRHAERLMDVKAACEKQGAQATITTGDVSDAAAMAAWISACDQLQPLDLVIANAGISGGTSGITAERHQVDRIFAVNLNGVLNTIHPALSLMLPRRQRQIAIMGSLAGFRGFAGSSAYAASKAAVRVYGESLRADLMTSGIKVNVVCPGFIQTPMTAINPFTMPFLMTAGRAAAIIQKGLIADQPRIAFPWPMRFLVHLLSHMPQDFINRHMGARFQKPPAG